MTLSDFLAKYSMNEEYSRGLSATAEFLVGSKFYVQIQIHI